MIYIYAIVGIICVIYYAALRIRLPGEFNKARNMKHDILTSWTKIVVDLSECSVKSNNYSHEVIVETGKAAQLNALFVRDIDNVKVEDVFQTVIFCTVLNPNDGKKYDYFSNVKYKDQKTVEIYCSLKKKIDLYVNPLNSSEYYFDLVKLFG